MKWKWKWEKTSETTIDIYPAIIVTFVIGYFLNSPTLVHAGIVLSAFKLVDIVYDIVSNLYNNFIHKE